MAAKKPRKLEYCWASRLPGRDRADGREDGAIGEVAQHEVRDGQDQDGGVKPDGAHVGHLAGEDGQRDHGRADPDEHLCQPGGAQAQDLAGHERAGGDGASTISTTRFSFSSVTDWSR